MDLNCHPHFEANIPSLCLATTRDCFACQVVCSFFGQVLTSGIIVSFQLADRLPTRGLRASHDRGDVNKPVGSKGLACPHAGATLTRLNLTTSDLRPSISNVVLPHSRGWGVWRARLVSAKIAADRSITGDHGRWPVVPTVPLLHGQRCGSIYFLGHQQSLSADSTTAGRSSSGSSTRGFSPS